MTRTESISGTTVDGRSSDSRLVAGVDGVSGGWVMAVTGAAPGSPIDEFRVFTSFADLWSYARGRGVLAVAVDIPIGLPDRRPRAADDEARARLKGVPGRPSSVFPAPPLCAIEEEEYHEANRRAKKGTKKGVSKQAFALFPKIREVRGALKLPDFEVGAVARALEVHPEVSFQAMAGSPMRQHKSRQSGVAQRLALLQLHFSNVVDAAVRVEVTGPPHPMLDDVLDAVAAAWTARRLVSEEAQPLGGREKDPEGYPMTIWA